MNKIVWASIIGGVLLVVASVQSVVSMSIQAPAASAALQSVEPSSTQVMSTTTGYPAAVYRWTKTWGGSGDDGAGRIAIDPWGNLYVVGSFTGTVNFDPQGVNPSATFTSYAGSIDAFLSKFDSNGNLLWAKTWGGPGRDVGYGVGVDGSGNAYVVGPFRYAVDFNPSLTVTEIYTSNADSENNIYLSKFSPSGTFQWVRTWGPALVPGKTSFGAEGYNVTLSGNYLYITGDFSGDQTDFNPWGSHDWHTNHYSGTGVIWFDSFLSKLDLDGNFQWAKTWGGEGYDDGPGAAVDSAGNVYVAGMYASQNINFDPAGGSGGLGHPAHDSGSVVDVFLSKFDSSGNFQWVKTFGKQDTEEASGTIAVDASNNVYIAGRFASVDCDFNPGGTPDLHSTHNPAPPGASWQRQWEAWDAFVSKYASDGTFQWAKTWGGNGQDYVMGLAPAGSSPVYVSGVFSTTADLDPGNGVNNHTSHGELDIFLSQFDPSGNLTWVKTWGGSGDDTSGVTLDEATGQLYTSGGFGGTVDFDPDSGLDNKISNGKGDAFLSKFRLLPYAIYLPLIIK